MRNDLGNEDYETLCVEDDDSDAVISEYTVVRSYLNTIVVGKHNQLDAILYLPQTQRVFCLFTCQTINQL